MRRPAEVLRHILDPSLKVDDKYATNVFETESGKVISGLVAEETRDVVKLIEDPLAKADPVALKRAEIVDRAKSKTSIMPRGLLDQLTREEVLDLLAYVVSRGDERDPCFQGAGHAHAHGPGH
ncbi:MAG: hypothetical protein JO252_17665 [Planctomycetaceae bacterium]|nr:hypothetical protein [Planctomycetaceae bacterium]